MYFLTLRNTGVSLLGTTLRKTFPLPALLVPLTGGALLLFLLVFSTLGHSSGVPQTITLTDHIDDYQLEAVLAYVKESPWELYDPETDDYVPENPDNPNTRDFRVTSIDLNKDGVNEVVLEDRRQYMCGSGGCTNYIFQKRDGQWFRMGRFFPGGTFEISEKARNGDVTIYFSGKENNYACVFQKEEILSGGSCH